MISRPTHFIYAETEQDRLCQGDILSKTPELKSLLSQYHAYYASQANYRFFQILTQSCDLVRRGGAPPSSAYITIAAVRPVEEAILREARKHQEGWQVSSSVISAKMRDRLQLFLESLLDNNQHGYFYLHEDISLGISGRFCAFLALSIPLRTEHYDLLLGAKIAQLKDEFQAKLGWLIGSMYSRVGTKEWDQHYTEHPASAEAAHILSRTFVTIADNQISEALQDLIKEKPLDEYDEREIVSYVRKKKMVPKITKFRARLGEVLSSEELDLVGEVARRIPTQLQADHQLEHELRIILSSDEPDAEKRVLRTVGEFLSSRVSRETLPGFDKLADRLRNTVAQDAVIRSLF